MPNGGNFSYRYLVKVMAVIIMFVSIAFLTSITSYSSDRHIHNTFNILSDNVSINAYFYVYDGADINDYPFEFDIIILKGTKEYKISTLIMARDNYVKAAEAIRKGTGWKNGYLFVPSECGGGNAWRCYKEHVFALREGNLIYIGAVSYIVDDDIKPGLSYKNGYFYDYYDRFESNKLTSHAGAPGLVSVMKEINGQLIVDNNRTWEFNASRYSKNSAKIESNRINKNAWQTEAMISPLLSNAVLAKYCDKKSELKLLLDIASQVLDNNKYGIFIEIINSVSHK